VEPLKLQPLSPSQRQALEVQTATYAAGLSDDAGLYLHNRGIVDAVQRGNRLGQVVDAAPGHERFAGMLAIPYLGVDGQPLDIRFGCMAPGCDHEAGYHAKYNTQKGHPARVFNVKAIHHAADVIHVTEGEMDCLVLEGLGLHAIALPGANSWQPHHRRMLAGFSRVMVWPDVDTAGAEFAAKALAAMRNAVIVRLPYGDVTDVWKAEGAAALLGLLEPKGLTA
jgi:hypothetical protein